MSTCIIEFLLYAYGSVLLTRTRGECHGRLPWVSTSASEVEPVKVVLSGIFVPPTSWAKCVLHSTEWMHTRGYAARNEVAGWRGRICTGYIRAVDIVAHVPICEKILDEIKTKRQAEFPLAGQIHVWGQETRVHAYPEHIAIHLQLEQLSFWLREEGVRVLDTAAPEVCGCVPLVANTLVDKVTQGVQNTHSPFPEIVNEASAPASIHCDNRCMARPFEQPVAAMPDCALHLDPTRF
jgi:hypothetical protein